MRIISSLAELKSAKLPATVIALGTFDGLHIGHQDILSAAAIYGRENKLALAVFTFQNHPLSEIVPELTPPLLLRREEKQAGFAAAGVDFLVCVPFTEELAAMPHEVFISLLAECNVRAVCVGANFSYGFRGQGNSMTLLEDCRKYGITPLVRPLINVNNAVVSSTNIRRFIMDGDMEQAAAMLGRPYSITGKVVHGDGRGRELGFPTANLVPDEKIYALPAEGVYRGVAFADGEYPALINVGRNPTFDCADLRMEVYLQGFTGDLYGKELRVSFLQYLRPEKKFSHAEELLKQIKKDLANLN